MCHESSLDSSRLYYVEFLLESVDYLSDMFTFLIHYDNLFL